MGNVEGKVAFITGAVSGIGLGVALALLKAGMKVAITYRTKNHLDEAMELLQCAESRVHAISLDVTDRAAVAVAADETVRRFGKIHVLISNAGVGPDIPLTSATYDDWDWCMGVNVSGVFNCIHTFLPRIRAHGEGGHIVATSSVFGGLLAGAFWGVYCTSKAAVVGMMEALRSELVHTNIGVSVFCPGPVTSNVQQSARNRPATLPQAGVPDGQVLARVQEFYTSVQDALKTYGGSASTMDAFEAGEHVLNGIRNNQLYILSHPEFRQAICDRTNALLASIPAGSVAAIPPARVAFAQVARNPIYLHELDRRRSMRPHE
ncbi:MAG TPA: SDR family oxidoreductase [Steroidobacteraceae bacterium]|jgi:NAD(P)-dependent dehydrogenase (short-subunit alcohol dehydrogenase family)